MMVSAVRHGTPMRSVAHRFHVSLNTVQRWVRRTQGQRLSRVDWTDRPAGCRRSPHRTPSFLEDRVLALRTSLKTDSALGEYGAEAIHRTLVDEGTIPPPTVRTIGRILARRGALDGRRRTRHPAPPKGWYLPDVVSGLAELDSFDIVEGLIIRGGFEVEVLNVSSLLGGLCGSWPASLITAKIALKCIIEHWQRVGLPNYAQFDNDTIFQGAHHWPDSFGRVIRLCLGLDVVPVFAPPQETGFQAAIENYNGRWQAKVWRRFEHAGYPQLQERSDAFVDALNYRNRARRDASPERRPWPSTWQMNLQAPLQGRIIYLRRTDEQGRVSMLGHRFPVSPRWAHRLVRAELSFAKKRIAFYSLRRRAYDEQDVLNEVRYEPPKKRFLE